MAPVTPVEPYLSVLASKAGWATSARTLVYMEPRSLTEPANVTRVTPDLPVTRSVLDRVVALTTPVFVTSASGV